ncbi:MAG: IMP cyclohydrolase [Halobacteriales archaeon]
MYIGRFVVAGAGIGAYRVSSRSFPNRKVTDRGGTLTIDPTEDAPETDNPYIAYNCAREVADGRPVVVLGNGSHVDPITEKLGMGYPARDALATALLCLDFEKDDYDTPRVAAVVGAETAHVGIVRRDALVVEEVAEPTLVATYEKNSPEAFDFDAESAAAAASEAYGLDFEHAVCAAGVEVTETGVGFAIENGD